MILLACATRHECLSAVNQPAASSPTPRFEPMRIRGRDFLPCLVGIGPVAAAMSVGAVLERHPDVTGILNLGICGSFDIARTPWARPVSPAPRSGRSTECAILQRQRKRSLAIRCSRI